MDNKAISQAQIACFMAFGQALGEERLTEAERHLRAVINDGGIERGAAGIIQSILVGINHRPQALHS